MTKEEARQFGLNLLHGIVERNKVSDPCYADKVKQAIDAISAPSLLFDLDETAKSCLKEALQKFYDTIGKPYALVNESEVNEFGEFLFRAGAVWMAGQGVKIGETKVYLEDDGDEPPYSQEWLDLETTEYQIPDGVFKNGDEVDIILRKK